MKDSLPNNWIECKLGDVVKIQNGYAFPSKDFKRIGDVPLIKQSQLDGNQIALKDCVYLDRKYLQTKKEFVLQRGDMLIGMSGSIGKLCLYDLDIPALQNQRTGRVVPHSTELDRGFLWYYLSTIEKSLKEKGKGLGVANVSASDIEELSFNLPPLAEQRRIVAKLEAVMAKVEANKRRLDKIPLLLKRFRQSVLAAAVSGKLTEEWRERNGGSTIEEIHQVIDRRKSSGIKRSRLNINLRNDLNLTSIPGNWEWCDLEFLLDESSNFCYGVVQPGADVVNQQKLIRVQDLANGKILDSQLRGISWKIDNEYKRSKVKANDLLVTVVGTIGRTAIVNDSQDGFNIARAVARVPIRDFSPYYVKLFIDSSLGQDWLNNDAREVARKTLNLDQLRTLPVPIPPQREQEEIVQRVKQLFSLADKLESRYIKAKGMLDKLPQSILAKAFRGELVEQDPDDEPAAALLERIKAEN